MTDPYAILGIPRDASDRQVLQAYRRLAMRYHPDRHPDGQTSEPMRRANEAWHILSSPARRRQYDAIQQRAATYGTARGTWEPALTSAPRPSTASTRDGTPFYPPHRATEEVGLPGALVVVAIAWLVLGSIFFGPLAAPIIGLAVLAGARSILAAITAR
jgi:curved DNA-binding protein CbpA